MSQIQPPAVSSSLSQIQPSARLCLRSSRQPGWQGCRSINAADSSGKRGMFLFTSASVRRPNEGQQWITARRPPERHLTLHSPLGAPLPPPPPPVRPRTAHSTASGTQTPPHADTDCRRATVAVLRPLRQTCRAAGFQDVRAHAACTKTYKRHQQRICGLKAGGSTTGPTRRNGVGVGAAGHAAPSSVGRLETAQLRTGRGRGHVVYKPCEQRAVHWLGSRADG